MTGGEGTILVANAGSSSLKLAFFGAEPPFPSIASGIVRRVGGTDAVLHMDWDGASRDLGPLSCADHGEALRLLLGEQDERSPHWRRHVVGVGHRVVHGGERYTEPTLVTTEVEGALEDLKELAPLHNGRAVEVIQAALRQVPGVPQVACFDTMFHSDLPPETRRYALPRTLSDRFAIRRYGFHGISCEGSMETLEARGVEPRECVIICHLGAGASVTAVRRGRSVDTSMGFTPLEGLIMATRSGSIDPSIVLYLQRHANMTSDKVERVLERESGLQGLSGASGDVGILEERATAGDPHAREALDAFAYAVRRTVGGYFAILGGLDVLVLTGGIGEHGVAMRERIIGPLGHMGLTLDHEANKEAGADEPRKISNGTNAPAIWVIPAREEQVIAKQVGRLVVR